MLAERIVRRRVALGAALLDKEVPGWRKRINANTLSVRSLCNCPLGQLFQSYANGCHSISLVTWGDFAEHGFDIDIGIRDEDGNDLYDQLTNEWRKVVLNA